MKTNKLKINLTNKICSTLFFAFTIINFILSILVVINVNGRNEIYKTILNFPYGILSFISIGLNAYLIAGMIIEDRNNLKNPMWYLLSITLLFTLIVYIYCLASLNNKPVDSNNFTAEF